MIAFIKNLIPTELKRAAWGAAVGLTTCRSTPAQRLPSTREFLDALSGTSTILDAAKGEASNNNLAAAKTLIVKHFRNRSIPRFFMSRTEAISLAEAISASHPECGVSALSAGRAILKPFTAVDESATQRLWRSPPLGPGRDKLAWHKPHQLPWAAHLARAQVYGLDTGDELQQSFTSWTRATDGIRNSPAYADALIVVHRGVNLTWALHFLAASKSQFDDLEFDMLRVLLTDVRFVYERLGQSFPNNHLLADGFFCWYVGILYPEFEGACRWLQDGQALWERELSRQVLSDGTSFEHSVHYHEVVCEMLTAYTILSIRNGRPLPNWVMDRARNMLAFQAALGGPEARTTNIGDGFEDYLFPLDDCNTIGSGAHREVLRHLYQPQVRPLCASARGLERALWLTSGLPKTDTSVSDRRDGPRTTYPRGGVFVLNNEDESNRLVFRTGPVANEAVAPGHMHADLLSVNVTVDKEPILVDPGTYSYRSTPSNWPRGTPPWRAHFMSPDAHNGPCIPGVDPFARGPGDFPCERPISRVHHDLLLIQELFSCVSASITGDSPYRGHVRTVVHVNREYWIVVDLFPNEQRDTMFLSYQCAFSANVETVDERSYRIFLGDASLGLTTANLGGASVLCGQTTPPAGWVSERYGTLQVAPCLRFRPLAGHGPTVTVLTPGAAQLPALTLSQDTPGILRLDVAIGSTVDVVALSLAGRDDAVLEIDHVRMTGTFCWYRQSGGVTLHTACALRQRSDVLSAAHSTPHNKSLAESPHAQAAIGVGTETAPRRDGS